MRIIWNNSHLNVRLLEKITPAIKFTVSGIALFTEYALTFTALHTLHVPRFVQHLHQVTLHDGLLATVTHERCHHLGYQRDLTLLDPTEILT